LPVAERVEHGHQHQNNDHPDREILEKIVQTGSLRLAYLIAALADAGKAFNPQGILNVIRCAG
jgi:hypothetical protein